MDREQLFQQFAAISEYLKKEEPLVHCLTHAITMNDSANVILSVGASPTMASHPREAEEVTALAKSLVVNLGNVDDSRLTAMYLSGLKARKLGIPTLFDAVGAGGISLRYHYAQKFIAACRPAIIKGNASEIRALLHLPSHALGVDAGRADTVTAANFSAAAPLFAAGAKKAGAVLMVTGPVDIITDGKDTVGVANGSPLMGRLTGTGCMLGALTGAFHCSGQSFAAAILAALTMDIAGENAASGHPGPGTFHIRLLDAIAAVTLEEIQQKCRLLTLAT